MQHFGGLTAKRHLGISNAETVGELDLGKLARSVLKKLASSKSKSATTYKSKSGRKAFAGSRFLKDTGWDPYDHHLATAYYSSCWLCFVNLSMIQLLQTDNWTFLVRLLCSGHIPHALDMSYEGSTQGWLKRGRWTGTFQLNWWKGIWRSFLVPSHGGTCGRMQTWYPYSRIYVAPATCT